ncbi:MAG: type IV pilus assembly protein PilB [Lysobacterales bacterium]
MKSLKDIVCEIQKHDVNEFRPILFTHKSITLAMAYLNEKGYEDMATYLGELAERNKIIQGPVEGFLAAACHINEYEHIVLSTKYEEYNTVEEMAKSIVHEIGLTERFKKADEEDNGLTKGMTQWLKVKEEQQVEGEDEQEGSKQTLVTDVNAEEIINTTDKTLVEPAIEQVLLENNSAETKKLKEALPVDKEESEPVIMRSELSPRKSLVENLLISGLINQEQLEDAKNKQKGLQKSLEETIVELEFITEDDLCEISEIIFDMKAQTFKGDDIDAESCQLIPYILANRHGVFPVRLEEDNLILAMSNPKNILALDDIRQIVSHKIVPVFCMASHISCLVDENYTAADEVYGLFKNVDEESVDVVDLGVNQKKDITADALMVEMDSEYVGGVSDQEKPDVPAEYQALLETESPIVKLVNLILSDAVKGRASDIHIEAREHIIEIRYRVDGDLKNIMKIPVKFHKQMVVRLKILSNLDIAQDITPQDGRINLRINGNKIDFRVSTIPTFHGEKIVMRILDVSTAKVLLDDVGFSGDDKGKFIEAIKEPQGMVFVTGPTGSGKTSTLYAALNHIKGETTNIVTVEDPIEFVHEGINQIQINAARGVTFASGLRSILRQDPNVILIGEIRDSETAEIAVKASLTGHLVLSTLHTNSAIGTITRLADIGLELYQIASAVIIIVSQRLVKKICEECNEEYSPDDVFKEQYKNVITRFNLNKFYHGKGCQECSFTGYRGRIAVMEIMKITEKLKSMISKNAPDEKLLEQAKSEGMKTLLEVGVEKVTSGITSLEEVIKSLGNIEEEITEDGSANTITTSKVVEEENKDGVSITEITPARVKPLVLAVDDEDDIRKILVKYLEMGGYDVIQAINGEEAIKITHQKKPDLIVIDVMMPVMNGFEATKILRSKLETAVIPIVMLTAKTNKNSELAGLAAGADDYLTKPFDKDKLLARINILLKRKN